MPLKIPPPLPLEEKKMQGKEHLAKMNPIFFPQSQKKARIHPRDLLNNPQALILGEILRPLE
jgi:hypothetical protein